MIYYLIDLIEFLQVYLFFILLWNLIVPMTIIEDSFDHPIYSFSLWYCCLEFPKELAIRKFQFPHKLKSFLKDKIIWWRVWLSNIETLYLFIGKDEVWRQFLDDICMDLYPIQYFSDLSDSKFKPTLGKEPLMLIQKVCESNNSLKVLEVRVK